MFAAFFALIFLLFPLVIVGFACAALAFWVWMIVDVATRESGPGNDQVVWLLVVLLAGFIGAVIYCFARKLPRDRAVRPPVPTHA